MLYSPFVSLAPFSRNPTPLKAEVSYKGSWEGDQSKFMATDRHVTRAKSDLDLSHGRVCFHPAPQGILTRLASTTKQQQSVSVSRCGREPMPLLGARN